MDAIRIAHISDLHFGQAGQTPVWRLLRKHLKQVINPHLVVVTGDIVDTPNRKDYELARTELDNLEVTYFVCPGNHDRHPWGNAPGKARAFWDFVSGPSSSHTWFDNIFGDRVPDMSNQTSVPLVEGNNKWIIRIASIDSSQESQFSARGLITLSDLDGVRTWASGITDDVDLTVLLVHHHLLPIPELEKSTANVLDLLNFTTLGNAGSLLEVLAQANIDLVLHGHEHHFNCARYGTLSGRQGEVMVIGAGSATGAVTGATCNPNMSSYNVLEFRRDRSVWIAELRYSNQSWTSEHVPCEIYDTDKLARTKFLRRTKIEAPPDSDIVKRIVFTAQRDAVIQEYRTNVILKEDVWRVFVRNTTGEPMYPAVYFTERNTTKRKMDTIGDFQPLTEDHTHCVEVRVPERVPRKIDRIDISYVWSAGALLCTQDMAILNPSHAGYYRKLGYEFGAVKAITQVASLSLTVTIPLEFVPDPDKIRVFVENPRVGNGSPTEAPELADHLQFIVDVMGGHISLIVPYPTIDCRYVLAWKVPSVESWRIQQPNHIRSRAREIGQELTSAFYKGFEHDPLHHLCSVSLYVPVVNQAYKEILLIRVGSHPIAEHPSESASIVLSDERNLFMHAWWGKTGIAISDMQGVPSPKERAKGLIDGEKALIVMPVRHGISWDRGAPWGIMRVGVGYNERAETLQNPQNVIDMLPRLEDSMLGVISTLSAAKGV